MIPHRSLLEDIGACRKCEAHLALGPRPVLQFHPAAKILIAGQAPGKKAHLSSIPFDDASGDRLREWLGVSRQQFYDASKIAILPMGFCFPGTGKSGDLPPRSECALAWRESLLSRLQGLELTLVLGKYALDYHLTGPAVSVTESVLDWRSHWPTTVPLPHPSPRNVRWFNNNRWFERELVPQLRERVALLLRGD